MIRNVFGILAAYALFIITSLTLFKVSGQDPHGAATIGFQIGTAFYGVFFSFLCGLILQRIAKTGTLMVNYILAAIIAGFAMFSLTQTDGSHWTQALAVVVFAPTSILGGLFYIRRKT